MESKQFQLLRVSGQPVTDLELLADLRRVAKILNATTVSITQYRQYKQFDDTTISRRFDTWNNALLAAGLTLSNEKNISDERLFENILTLWQHYGRQPRRSELAKPPSVISQSPYTRRFHSWVTALEAFIEYANAVGTKAPTIYENIEDQKHIGRDLSLRLRWKVLQRDRFTCCGCGASPALNPGVELHVDHIKPYSKGGGTALENLQTLCSACNFGKSNWEPPEE
jgi:hypothetical protein